MDGSVVWHTSHRLTPVFGIFFVIFRLPAGKYYENIL